MKKLLSLFLFAFCAFNPLTLKADSQCPQITSANSFNITEKVFAIGNDFNISTSGKSAGKVIQRTLHWGTTFDLVNEKNQLVAVAQEQVFTFGVKIKIYDCNKQFIGELQEDVLKSFFKVQTTYMLLDPQGRPQGKSTKLDLWGTDIIFFDAQNKMVASLKRPAFKLIIDKWELQFDPSSAGAQIDRRLIFFTAAYKTAADNRRRAEAEAKSNTESMNKQK